jgi:hypothetical protein
LKKTENNKGSKKIAVIAVLVFIVVISVIFGDWGKLLNDTVKDLPDTLIPLAIGLAALAVYKYLTRNNNNKGDK